MSRRTFIRRLSVLGVSAGAAITYSYALKPESAAAATAPIVIYPDIHTPAVTTGAASAIAPTGATLAATVDANLQRTLCWFEFGTTTAYGDASRPVDAGSAGDPGPVSIAVAGLLPGTLYHYRAVAQNGAARVEGVDATFTTAASPTPPRDTAAPVLGLEVAFITRASLLRGRKLGVVVMANETVSGTLTATVRVPARRRSPGRRATPARDVALGTVAFSLPAPGGQKVVIALSSAGVAALRAIKAPVVTVVGNGTDTAGNPAPAVRAVARF